MAKAALKQPEVMIIESLKEWDRQRERRAKPRKEPVKIELDGPKTTILVRVELTEP